MTTRQTKDVAINFRDDLESDIYTTVIIDGLDVAENDENIFYYFSDEKEYQDALKNGTHEFTMKEMN